MWTDYFTPTELEMFINTGTWPDWVYMAECILRGGLHKGDEMRFHEDGRITKIEAIDQKTHKMQGSIRRSLEHYTKQ